MQATKFNKDGKYEFLSEINMIPMIDVSLVLLIIFMIMTPYLMKSKISVNLPKAASAEQLSNDAKVLEVQILDSGTIMVDGKATKPEAVEQAIRDSIKDPRAGSGVLVEADKAVPFQQFVTVVDAARKVGVAKFGVAVRQDEAAKKGARSKGR